MRKLIYRIRRAVRRTGGMPVLQISAAGVLAMVQQIERTSDVEMACDEVQRLLGEFAERVARGEDASRLMPLIEKHLELCPDCREEYEALLRILRAVPA